jgi:hypothetical protein
MRNSKFRFLKVLLLVSSALLLIWLWFHLTDVVAWVQEQLNNIAKGG